MLKKVGPIGGTKGGAFDDGVFNGVKKITVGKEYDCVTHIKIEYENDGYLERFEHGNIRGVLNEFTFDYPNEYITAIGGSYGHVPQFSTVIIKSLFFKTSYGTTSPLFGSQDGTQFLLQGESGGEKLVGFWGRSGDAIDALGAHFVQTGGGGGGGAGGNTGGSAGGNTGGGAGGNTGGGAGGNTGGGAGGNKGGDAGGNRGSGAGGNKGGDSGGNRGSSAGGNKGGDAGGNTGGWAGRN